MEIKITPMRTAIICTGFADPSRLSGENEAAADCRRIEYFDLISARIAEFREQASYFEGLLSFLFAGNRLITEPVFAEQEQ